MIINILRGATGIRILDLLISLNPNKNNKQPVLYIFTMDKWPTMSLMYSPILF